MYQLCARGLGRMCIHSAQTEADAVSVSWTKKLDINVFNLTSIRSLAGSILGATSCLMCRDKGMSNGG